MVDRKAGMEVLASESRSEHCKIYVEPSLKRAIQNFANREGLTFSEAGRVLWLNAEEMQHELNIIATGGE